MPFDGPLTEEQRRFASKTITLCISFCISTAFRSMTTMTL